MVFSLLLGVFYFLRDLSFGFFALIGSLLRCTFIIYFIHIFYRDCCRRAYCVRILVICLHLLFDTMIGCSSNCIKVSDVSADSIALLAFAALFVSVALGLLAVFFSLITFSSLLFSTLLDSPTRRLCAFLVSSVMPHFLRDFCFGFFALIGSLLRCTFIIYFIHIFYRDCCRRAYCVRIMVICLHLLFGTMIGCSSNCSKVSDVSADSIALLAFAALFVSVALGLLAVFFSLITFSSLLFSTLLDSPTRRLYAFLVSSVMPHFLRDFCFGFFALIGSLLRCTFIIYFIHIFYRDCCRRAYCVRILVICLHLLFGTMIGCSSKCIKVSDVSADLIALLAFAALFVSVALGLLAVFFSLITFSSLLFSTLLVSPTRRLYAFLVSSVMPHFLRDFCFGFFALIGSLLRCTFIIYFIHIFYRNCCRRAYCVRILVICLHLLFGTMIGCSSNCIKVSDVSADSIALLAFAALFVSVALGLLAVFFSLITFSSLLFSTLLKSPIRRLYGFFGVLSNSPFLRDFGFGFFAPIGSLLRCAVS